MNQKTSHRIGAHQTLQLPEFDLEAFGQASVLNFIIQVELQWHDETEEKKNNKLEYVKKTGQTCFSLTVSW